MDLLECDVMLALEALGLTGHKVYNARYEGDELVLLVDCGILGIQKHRLPCESLRLMAVAPEPEPAPIPVEIEKPKTVRRRK